QAERDPVASPHVFEFVRECASQIGVVPHARVRGKGDRPPHDATGHRAGYRLVHHHIDGAADSGATRQTGRHRLRITPWQTMTAYATNLPQSQRDRYETA